VPPTVVLAIDTSTPRGSVAIRRHAAREGQRATEAEGISASDIETELLSSRFYEGTTDHAEKLLFEIDAALAEAGLSLADVSVIAGCTGPGSFTGVRVGVSTVKAISLATGSRVVAATSLSLMALGCALPGVVRVPILDARRGELFAAAFHPDGSAVAEPAHLRLDELAGWLAALEAGSGGAGVVLLGEMASRLSSAEAGPGLLSPATSHVHRSVHTDLPSAEVLSLHALWHLAAGHPPEPSSFEPFYLRAPDATLPAARLSS
jgi:tRNA threonylcarbamoyladenosine biosynthesis protein TsaB